MYNLLQFLGYRPTYNQGCARLMNQRQHDSSYQPLAMDSSPQFITQSNVTLNIRRELHCSLVLRNNKQFSANPVGGRSSNVYLLSVKTRGGVVHPLSLHWRWLM